MKTDTVKYAIIRIAHTNVKTHEVDFILEDVRLRNVGVAN